MVEVTPRGKSVFDDRLMETMEEVGMQTGGEIGVDEELGVDDTSDHATSDGEDIVSDNDSLSSTSGVLVASTLVLILVS